MFHATHLEVFKARAYMAIKSQELSLPSILPTVVSLIFACRRDHSGKTLSYSSLDKCFSLRLTGIVKQVNHPFVCQLAVRYR